MIGNPREEVLAEAMQKLERHLGREINCTVLTRKEFESRRARKDVFLEIVWKNKGLCSWCGTKKLMPQKVDSTQTERFLQSAEKELAAARKTLAQFFAGKSTNFGRGQAVIVSLTGLPLPFSPGLCVGFRCGMARRAARPLH